MKVESYSDKDLVTAYTFHLKMGIKGDVRTQLEKEMKKRPHLLVEYAEYFI